MSLLHLLTAPTPAPQKKRRQEQLVAMSKLSSRKLSSRSLGLCRPSWNSDEGRNNFWNDEWDTLDLHEEIGQNDDNDHQTTTYQQLRSAASNALFGFERTAPVAAPFTQPTTKKISFSKTTASEQRRKKPLSKNTSLLHESCRLYASNETVISSALQFNKNLISTQASTETCVHKSACCCKSRKRKALEDTPTLPSYPLNIALRHGASLAVVKRLANADPSVLLKKDDQGEANGAPTLCIALARYASEDIIAQLVKDNKKAASIPDRKFSYPLHVACTRRYSVFVINLLLEAYPEALKKRNVNGKTPLEVAQKSAYIDDAVINYLQQKAFQSLESRMTHL